MSEPSGAPPQFHDSAPEGAGRLRLQEIARVLLARRNVIITTASLVVAVVMTFTLLETPEYEARSTIQIEQVGPDILTFKDILSVDRSYQGYSKFYQTQYKLLGSRAVLVKAVESLDLTNRPEFAARKPSPLRRVRLWIGRKLGTAADADPVAEAVEFIQQGLRVVPVRESQLVQISFTNRSPDLAASVVNAVAGAYLNFNYDSRYETTRVAREFLTKEVLTVRGEITRAEKELQDYTKSKDLLETGQGAGIEEDALAEVSRREVDLRSRAAVSEARYLAVRDVPPQALPEVLNSPLIARLKEQTAEIERRHSQMAERFKEDWPPLMQVRTELDNAGARLDEEAFAIAEQVRQVAEADYRRTRAEAVKLGGEVTEQKRKVQRVQRDAVESAALKGEIESKRAILAGLMARQSETASSERMTETGTSNIRVVDKAETPSVPVSPKKLANLLLSILFGSFAGIGAALLLDHFDNTIKTAADVVRLTGIPILGDLPLYQSPLRAADAALPSPSARAQVDLASHIDPRSSLAESFKGVRASLLLAAASTPRHVMVTSCQPKDGKSTVSVNLATVLSQLGRRVLLVDADLRVPRLHGVLGLPSDVGLSSYLSGNATIDEIVQDTAVPGLKAITAGPIPPNPSELLGSPRLYSLLQCAGPDGRFDCLIFDSSPLLSVSDPFILASHVDATILVVRAHETTRESLGHASGRLRQARARVIGVVLNGVSEGEGYRYYGRYRSEETPAQPRASSRRKRWVS